MRNIYLAALLALAAGSLLGGPADAQSQFFRIERGIDRPGNDISSAPSPDANACSFACQASNVCRAFTFVLVIVGAAEKRHLVEDVFLEPFEPEINNWRDEQRDQLRENQPTHDHQA